MQTSYSQVTRAEECLRKYAFGVCDGLYEPQRKSGADGDTVHALNEGYVKYGLPFPKTRLGKLCELGIDYLPTRADDPVCEVKEHVGYGRHTFAARADVAWIGPAGPVIMDYKTVAHFGWALTPARLRMDLQAAINCLWAMKKYDCDEAIAWWLYYRKPDENKPDDVGEVRSVEVVIEREMAHRVLRQKDGVLQKMEGLKARPTRALNVVGNEGACKNYGGCWYRHKCFPDAWMLDAEGKKSIPREVESEYREAPRARV